MVTPSPALASVLADANVTAVAFAGTAARRTTAISLDNPLVFHEGWRTSSTHPTVLLALYCQTSDPPKPNRSTLPKASTQWAAVAAHGSPWALVPKYTLPQNVRYDEPL